MVFLKTIVSGVQKQRDTFPRRCVHIGHALDIGQKADWRGLQWQVATSADGNTGNWIVEEFSSTIHFPVLVCPITKGQGIRMVDHVMAVSSKVTLELTAIKCDSEVGWKRQNKSGVFWMEWKALFCFVVWRGNSSFYAFALGSFYVECLVACIIVRSFPLCGIILL